MDFVYREGDLQDEYEAVLEKGETPDGGGRLIEIFKTSDGYSWQLWDVDTYESARYLAGSFGTSVPDSDRKNREYYKAKLSAGGGQDWGIKTADNWWQKELSYEDTPTRWCIATDLSTSNPGYSSNFWDSYSERGSEFVFLIREDDYIDKYSKIAFEYSVWDGEIEKFTYWDSSDSNKGFDTLKYPCFDELHKRLLKWKEGDIIEKSLKKSGLATREDGAVVWKGDIPAYDNPLFEKAKREKSFDFLKKYNIEHIEGSVYFHCLDDFRDFSGLLKIKTIGGSLRGVKTDKELFYFRNLEEVKEVDLRESMISTLSVLKNLVKVEKFDCQNCQYLISLEGCEKMEVDGYFGCSYCPSLTSLAGAPKKVGGSFNCCVCKNLTSLEGAPKKVGGNFICYDCASLTSLHGAPVTVYENFNCGGCKNLTSLAGAPKKVGGYFNCSSCPRLTSLEGAPKKVGGDFGCFNCKNLTSLVGAPTTVGGDFNCSHCPELTSLEGAPVSVKKARHKHLLLEKKNKRDKELLAQKEKDKLDSAESNVAAARELLDL